MSWLTRAGPGPPEINSGVINKLGVDLGGTREGVMIWAVYALTTRAAGFLVGTYAGASAEITVGGGVGANMLVGGSFRTVELQPFASGVGPRVAQPKLVVRDASGVRYTNTWTDFLSPRGHSARYDNASRMLDHRRI
jgi:Protein of unknown function (DUF992)